MEKRKKISEKIFEFAEKNSWLWDNQKAWDAYEKYADENEGFYPFFKRYFLKLPK